MKFAIYQNETVIDQNDEEICQNGKIDGGIYQNDAIIHQSNNFPSDQPPQV